MTEAPWVHEFRRRISWALAPEHYRHGFVGDVVVQDYDHYDPTFSYETDESMSITITGFCPCGKCVIVESEGAIKSAELIRLITADDTDERMKTDTNPYVEYQTKGEVR
jgi:hypothetical protein